MACLLGIEDEPFGKDDSSSSTNYQVNKVGGKPVIFRLFCFFVSLKSGLVKIYFF